jgi:hypothetical protein
LAEIADFIRSSRRPLAVSAGLACDSSCFGYINELGALTLPIEEDGRRIKMANRFRSATVLGALAVLIAHASFDHTFAADPIKVGFSMALTGA